MLWRGKPVNSSQNSTRGETPRKQFNTANLGFASVWVGYIFPGLNKME